MRSEKVSMTQGVLAILLFNFGSSVIRGVSNGAGQDAWISIIMASVMAALLFLLYARIMRLFPEKDLFEIMETVFGKVVGKILSALMICYAVLLAAHVLRDFAEFTEISAMPETPQLPIMIIMVLAAVYLALSRMRAIGKWSVAAVFIVLFVVLFTFSMAIPMLKLDMLRPFLSHSPSQLAKASVQVFTFPFAETVIFLCLAGAFRKKDSPYKLLLYALLLTAVVFLLIFLRNLSVLGLKLREICYFPSYVAARIIEIGSFLSRIEGSISSNFLLADMVKTSACLLAAGKGFTSLFNLRNYRYTVPAAGVISLILANVLYKNTMQMFVFFDENPYLALPFQVAIPLAVWIAGEIHIKRLRRAPPQPTPVIAAD